MTYDGPPRFSAIGGTSMQYAVNTASTVILLDGRYYACDQGVWYEGVSPTGPWRVCASVPEVIYTIPPSSPVYGVTYVQVYSATPRGGLRRLHAWIPGQLCVARVRGLRHRLATTTPGGAPPTTRGPLTWGYHARYNPWYGWSYGLSYATSPFVFTHGWGFSHYGGWWGPGWYRPYPWYGSPYGYGYRAGYRHGYWHGAQWDHAQPPRGSTRPAPGPERSGSGTALHRQNIYARDTNRNRIAQLPPSADRARPAPAIDRPNDVIADRDGNVYRRSADGTWERREGGAWRPSDRTAGGLSQLPSSGDTTRPSVEPTWTPRTGGTTRPGVEPPREPNVGGSTRPGVQLPGLGGTTQPGPARPSTVDREWAARQRGQQRAQTYRSAPPARVVPPAPKPKPAATASSAKPSRR